MGAVRRDINPIAAKAAAALITSEPGNLCRYLLMKWRLGVGEERCPRETGWVRAVFRSGTQRI